MTDREKYIIKIEGELIEVTPDIYYAYFRMERQERGQEEKKQRNSVLSYDALDTGESTGEETIPDLISPSVEEQAIAKEMVESIRRIVEELPRAERELIKAIYYDGKTEKEYADEVGMSQTGVSYRRKKTLSKLKSYLEVLGDFSDYLL